MSAIFGFADKTNADVSDVLRRMSETMCGRAKSEQLAFFPGIGVGCRRKGTDGELIGHGHRSEIIVLIDGYFTNSNELLSKLNAEDKPSDPNDLVDLVKGLYRTLGIEFLKYAEGAYSLAILEGTSLYLARDGLGLRPLYYALGQGKLYFASEIKAISTVRSTAPTLDIDSLYERYVFGDHLLADSTYLNGIYQVLPGSYISFSVQDSVHESEFDLFDTAHEDLKGLEPPDIDALIRETVYQNVRQVLATYDSVGILLSGGFDSSVLASIIAEQSSGRIKTFTISDDDTFPDVLSARKVAKFLDADHHEIIVDPIRGPEFVVDGVWAYEDMTYRDTIFQLANHIDSTLDVVVSGVGADLFGGPSLMQNKLPRIVNNWRKLERLDAFDDAGSRINDYMSSLLPSLETDAAAAAFMHYVSNYIPNQLAPSTERAMSSKGMETAFPFAHMKLAQIAQSVPPHLKNDGEFDKPYLKRVFQNIDLPPSVSAREKLCSKQNLTDSKSITQSMFCGAEFDSEKFQQYSSLVPQAYLRSLFSVFHGLFVEQRNPEEIRNIYRR